MASNKIFSSTRPLEGCEPWYKRDHTDRSLVDYEKSTGVDFSTFTGKTILDLGSGQSGLFVREALDKGINAFGVNPNWATGDISKYPDLASELPRKKCVAATAGALPFANESFDFVISLGAIPFYLPGTKEDYSDAFSEVFRVMKPDSWAVFDPIGKELERNPAFIEIIHRIFGPEQCLIVNELIPKLIVAKEPTDETIYQIKGMIPDMVKSCFPLW